MTKNKISELQYDLQVQSYIEILDKNYLLKQFYSKNYEDFNYFLKSNHIINPAILEIGCGPSFLKKYYPNLISSDIEKHSNCDFIANAKDLPFDKESIDVIFLHNVFHHIDDIDKFFKQADKCLRKNGIIYLIDPNYSCFSKIIYKYFHHEKFDLNADWKFNSSNPQLDSNQALSWIVFERDIEIFKNRYPNFKIIEKKSFSFLTYLLSGGFNYNINLPKFLCKIIFKIDNYLSFFMKNYLGLFQKIIIKKL